MARFGSILVTIHLIIAATCAIDVTLPPNMQTTSLTPKYGGNFMQTKWTVKACNQCKIIAICSFHTDSCKVARIKLQTGEGEEQIKCPQNGRSFLTPSFRNEMKITIENAGPRIGASCSVKSTKPFIGVNEPAEPNSREYGLENKVNEKPTCRCGWTNKSPQRIVNGTNAALHEYPFIARIVLRKSKAGFCGGSIITSRHVLTASHCTVPYMKYALSVIVGEHDVTTSAETSATRVVDVARVINHPQYDRSTEDHDISILLLSDSIQFNNLIGPVCLPSYQEDLLGKYIKVMGWGRLKDESLGGQTSSILKKVNLLVIDPSICKAVFLTNPYRRSQICTFRNNKDSCTGDSGGPLVSVNEKTNMYKQVAVVSYGLKCANTNPGVNTDVAHYMNWIRDVIKATAPVEICY